jgi:hypothetical protein
VSYRAPAAGHHPKISKSLLESGRLQKWDGALGGEAIAEGTLL